MSQQELSEFEEKAGERARHRAMISRIVHAHPGLTVQQIIKKEREWYGYTFLTDNRLRELLELGWVFKEKGDGLNRWYPKPEQEEGVE